MQNYGRLRQFCTCWRRISGTFWWQQMYFSFMLMAHTHTAMQNKMLTYAVWATFIAALPCALLFPPSASALWLQPTKWYWRWCVPCMFRPQEIEKGSLQHNAGHIIPWKGRQLTSEGLGRQERGWYSELRLRALPEQLACLQVAEGNLGLIPKSLETFCTPSWRWHGRLPPSRRPRWDISLMWAIRRTSQRRNSLNPLNSRSRFSSLSLSCFYPGKVLLSMHALFQLNPFPH